MQLTATSYFWQFAFAPVVVAMSSSSPLPANASLPTVFQAALPAFATSYLDHSSEYAATVPMLATSAVQALVNSELMGTAAAAIPNASMAAALPDARLVASMAATAAAAASSSATHVGNFGDTHCLLNVRVNRAAGTADARCVTRVPFDALDTAAATVERAHDALRWRSAYIAAPVAPSNEDDDDDAPPPPPPPPQLCGMSLPHLAAVISLYDMPDLAAVTSRMGSAALKQPLRGGVLGVLSAPVDMPVIAALPAETRVTLTQAFAVAIRRFARWLLELPLPSVLEVIAWRSFRDATQAELDVTCATAPDYVFCASLLRDLMYARLTTAIRAFATISAAVDPGFLAISSDTAIAQLVALMSTLAREYLRVRYVDMLFFEECARAVLGYLVCDQPFAYAGVVPERHAIQGRHAVVHRRYAYRAAPDRGFVDSPLTGASMDVRAPSYAFRTISRLYQTPLVTAAHCYQHGGSTTVTTVTAALVIALCWRFFVITHLTPLFMGQTAHRDQMALTLSPFLDARIRPSGFTHRISLLLLGSVLRTVVNSAFQMQNTNTVLTELPFVNYAGLPYEVRGTPVASGMPLMVASSLFTNAQHHHQFSDDDDEGGDASDDDATADKDREAPHVARKAARRLADDGTVRQFATRQDTLFARLTSVDKRGDRDLHRSRVNVLGARSPALLAWIAAFDAEFIPVTKVPSLAWNNASLRSDLIATPDHSSGGGVVFRTIAAPPAAAAVAAPPGDSAQPPPPPPHNISVVPYVARIDDGGMPPESMVLPPLAFPPPHELNRIGVTYPDEVVTTLVAMINAHASVTESAVQDRSRAEIARPKLRTSQFLAVYAYYVNHCQNTAPGIYAPQVTRIDLAKRVASALGLSCTRAAALRIRLASPFYPLAQRLAAKRDTVMQDACWQINATVLHDNEKLVTRA